MSDDIYFNINRPYPSEELAKAAAEMLKFMLDGLAEKRKIMLRRELSIACERDFVSGVEWWVSARFSVLKEGIPGIYKIAPIPTPNGGF